MNVAFFWLMVTSVLAVKTAASTVGLIRNVSLMLYDVNSTTISGTCQQCLCKLFLNGSYSSFNCNDDQLTCQMYWKDQQSQSYSLKRNSSNRFYFLSFPVNSTSMTTDIVQITTGLFVSIVLHFERRGLNRRTRVLLQNYVEEIDGLHPLQPS